MVYDLTIVQKRYYTKRDKKMLLTKFSIHVVYLKKSLNKANINPEK